MCRRPHLEAGTAPRPCQASSSQLPQQVCVPGEQGGLALSQSPARTLALAGPSVPLRGEDCNLSPTLRHGDAICTLTVTWRRPGTRQAHPCGLSPIEGWAVVARCQEIPDWEPL